MKDSSLIKKILKDVKVELTDEFDRNFERKAFFDRPWQPLSPDYEPHTGSMLMRTGALRRSISCTARGNLLTYSSSIAYAAIHNYGGTIHQNFTPTQKMRRWAWAMYHHTQDEKYRRIALARRINRNIHIPARPFIGYHPRLDKIVTDAANAAIKQYTDITINNITKTIK